MNTTEIEVSTHYTKEWKIKHTEECVQYDSEHNHFYHFQGAGKCVLDFPASEAKQYLEICDQAVTNKRHQIPVAKLFNTSFLSMVLTQFLHVRKSEPAHDVEENLPTQPTVITDSSKLVVGKWYADTLKANQTILEFVKSIGTTDYFKYVSGDGLYLKDENGLIRLSSHNDWYPINN